MRREIQMVMLHAERERLATQRMVASAIEAASEQGRRAAEQAQSSTAALASPARPFSDSAEPRTPDNLWPSVQRLEEAVADRDKRIASLETEPRRLQQLISERDRAIAALQEKEFSVERAVANAVAERDRSIALLKKEKTTLGTHLETRTEELQVARKQLIAQAEAHAKSLEVTRKLETAAAEMNAAVESRDAAHDKLLTEVRSRSESSKNTLTQALAEAREQVAELQAQASALSMRAEKAELELEHVRGGATAREASLTRLLDEARAHEQTTARQQEEQLASALREAKQVESAASQIVCDGDALGEAVAELQLAKLKAQHAAEAQKLEAVRLEANQASYVMSLQTESAAREVASAAREAAQAKTIQSMQAELQSLRMSLKVASEHARESNAERDEALSMLSAQISAPLSPPESTLTAMPGHVAPPTDAPAPTPAPATLPAEESPHEAPPTTAPSLPALQFAAPPQPTQPLAASPPATAPDAAAAPLATPTALLLDTTPLMAPPVTPASPTPCNAVAPAAPTFQGSPIGSPIATPSSLKRAGTAPSSLMTGGTGETVGSVFRRYDSSGTGLLDAKLVRLALADLGIEIAQPGIAATLAKLEASGHVGLSMADFRRLRKALLAIPPPTPTIGDVWRRMSTDASGIHAHQLAEAMGALGLQTNTPGAAAALAYLAGNPDARVPLDAFRKLSKEIRACQAAGTGETVGQVFKRLDSASTGTIDVAEAGGALSDLGFHASTSVHAEALAQLTAAGVATLSLEDFRVFVKSIKAGKPMLREAESTLTDPGPRRWVYMDRQSSVQGPFEEAQILTWIIEGVLPLELLLRPVDGSTKDLRTLSALLAVGGELEKPLAVLLAQQSS